MALANLTGQRAAVELLQRSLRRQRLAHAYLFVGERGPRMEAVGRELAKAVNCRQGPGDDACDRCDSCLRTDRGVHPDVFWVRPELKSRRISIEQIRDVAHSLSLKPHEGRMKVAVIVDAECLGSEAGNAFLKTLEEPAAHSIILLLTNAPDLLLETIVSRCLRIHLEDPSSIRLSAEQEQMLELLLAAFSRRRVAPVLGTYSLLGRVFELLATIREAKTQEVAARFQIEKFADADPDYREKLEKQLAAAVEAEYRQARSDLLRVVSIFLRDLHLLVCGGDPRHLILAGREAQMRPLTGGLTVDWLLERIDTVEEIQTHLRQNIQEALALEVGFLKLIG